MRHRALAAILVAVVGCSSPIGLADVEVREPPQAWIDAYHETAACLGVIGYPHRVTWNKAQVTLDGEPKRGAWMPAHRIYLAPRFWDAPEADSALQLVRHEALHDLTQSSSHDVAPECDPLYAPVKGP